MAPDGGDIAELAERAIALAEQTAGTQAEIVRQQAENTGTVATLRKVTIGLAVSLAVDITLTVVVLFLTGHQADLTHAIHKSQLASCAIGNDFRARQAQVWEHVLAVSTPPANETPAERTARLAKVDAFRVYVARQFHPVDCTALYGK